MDSPKSLWFPSEKTRSKAARETPCSPYLDPHSPLLKMTCPDATHFSSSGDRRRGRKGRISRVHHSCNSLLSPHDTCGIPPHAHLQAPFDWRPLRPRRCVVLPHGRHRPAARLNPHPQAAPHQHSPIPLHPQHRVCAKRPRAARRQHLHLARGPCARRFCLLLASSFRARNQHPVGWPLGPPLFRALQPINSLEAVVVAGRGRAPLLPPHGPVLPDPGLHGHDAGQHRLAVLDSHVLDPSPPRANRVHPDDAKPPQGAPRPPVRTHQFSIYQPTSVQSKHGSTLHRKKTALA